MSEPNIIDGNAIAQRVKDSLRPRIASLKERGIIPGLAAVLIGDDPASKVYVAMKARDFAGLDLFSETIRMPADASQSEVLSVIDRLNRDGKFHGILVQLPVPKHLNEMEIIEYIHPDKDADGIHPMSMGKMILGLDGPLPCTPYGILMLLKYSGIDPQGEHVVVLGRSNIVGKPIANLLFQKKVLGNATVTVCHTRTRNLKEITRQADILIAALGQPEFVDASFVKDGVVIIDVGINRVDDHSEKRGYRLVGDVKFDEVLPKAAAITPVPGGVGPMTRAMLLSNTVYLAKKFATKQIEGS